MVKDEATPYQDKQPGGDELDVARSRTSLKKERINNEKALAQLVKELLALPAPKWEKLGVPELTVDALVDAAKIKSYAARERHMRLVRSTLRDADWTRVRRRLDQMRAGFAVAEAPTDQSSPAEVWSEQLLVQGDAGLARFVLDFPDTDRKRLRQLVRNVTKAPDNKRGKARKQLERAVHHELGKIEEE